MEKIDSSMDNRYSIVIPAYNAEKTLEFCLESLSKQSITKDRYEIIVVDDGSTDGTSDIAVKFDVKYLHQANQGPAAARNRGAREATGDIILFTDSDCQPDLEWIEEMVRPFRDESVTGVKGAYKTKQKRLAARFVQAEFEDRFELLKKYPSIDMVDTYSAAYKKDIFLKMGGFDENFPVANNEDTDLSYRLVKAGYKLLFNPKAFVYHIHPDSFRKYLRIKFWRGYWRMVVYKRFPNKTLKDSYTPTVIKVQTLLMTLSLPFLFLSLFNRPFLWPVFISWAFIILSSFRFSIKTAKEDRLVGLISPIVIFLRSFVFAIGSLAGIVRSLTF